MFENIPEFPYHIVWLATNKCNANCNHCSSDSQAIGLKDELSYHEVLSMIDEFRIIGVFDFAISGGEALLRKDIFDIIKYAKDSNLNVSIGTNGLCVTPEILEELKHLGISRFQISIDGKSGTHDKLRNFPGLYDIAIKSIKESIKIGLHTNICFTINRYNYFELEETIRYAIKLGVKRINISRFIPTGRGNKHLDLSNEQWKITIENCNDLYNKYVNKIEITTHLSQLALFEYDFIAYPSFMGCQAGISQCCITSEGNVYPCVLLPITVGNIKNSSFTNIWKNSPVISNLQNRMVLKGKCGKCTYVHKCGGCRANAYAETMDYLETDLRCWM